MTIHDGITENEIQVLLTHLTVPLMHFGLRNRKEACVKDCGLSPERGSVLEYPTTQDRPGRKSEGGCCARRVLEAERDF